MIKTMLTVDDAKAILEVGRRLHEESQFCDEEFDEAKCWALLESTHSHPEHRFIAFDSEYRGFILMSLAEHYFSKAKKVQDYVLYIVPEHRGGSLVVRLINEATQWAYVNGARDITIYHNTGIQTDKAPRLFNKLGFDLAGYIFTKDLRTCAE